eukprot:m.23335 g.23335  ORF g.23335 m.23335 type:complete len:53 (-) comp9373_c0_seq1:180-338(-)
MYIHTQVMGPGRSKLAATRSCVKLIVVVVVVNNSGECQTTPQGKLAHHASAV